MVDPKTDPKAVPDAKNRAARTFLWGLLSDVIFAVVMTLDTALNTADFSWDKKNWVLLTALLGKTAVMTGVSYVMRFLKPPPAPTGGV